MYNSFSLDGRWNKLGNFSRHLTGTRGISMQSYILLNVFYNRHCHPLNALSFQPSLQLGRLVGCLLKAGATGFGPWQKAILLWGTSPFTSLSTQVCPEVGLDQNAGGHLGFLCRSARFWNWDLLNRYRTLPFNFIRVVLCFGSHLLNKFVDLY